VPDFICAKILAGVVLVEAEEGSGGTGGGEENPLELLNGDGLLNGDWPLLNDGCPLLNCWPLLNGDWLLLNGGWPKPVGSARG
jgi:hypothetical protein